LRKIINRIIILQFLLLAHQCAYSQSYSAPGKIQIDTALKGDYSFIEKWSYSWPFEKDNNGKFVNPISDEPITREDTIPHFYTACCWTNHNAVLDTFHYCEAILNGDTLFLNFSNCDPSFCAGLIVKIHNDSFSTKYTYHYEKKVAHEKLNYNTSEQNLILNFNHFRPGVFLKGSLNLILQESFSAPGYNAVKQDFYIRGTFQTKIEKR
jgi:hypothetical protein